MKIGILGGSFNPPHVGHALVASQVREAFSLDEVWYMPAFKHPFDKHNLPVEHRLAMLRFLQNDFSKVSTLEIDKGNTSYTIDTLIQLEKLHPSDTFYWISGADQLAEITLWKDWKKLITRFNFLLFPRQPIFQVTEEYIKKILHLSNVPKNITIIHNDDLVLTNISSTMIRNHRKSGKSIQYLVPAEIELYIRKHRLYE